VATVAELSVQAEFSAEENALCIGWKLERRRSTSFVLTLPGSDGKLFSLLCLCDHYSAEPPAWHWYNTETEQCDQPKDTPTAAGFFHPNGVICAPWNRLAYKTVDSRGPHEDWQIGDWRSNPKNGACRTLSAMAIRIAHELKKNLQGRMAV
jgi:hypothetical protein